MNVQTYQLSKLELLETQGPTGQHHLFNKHVIRVPEREKRLNIAELEKKQCLENLQV